MRRRAIASLVLCLAAAAALALPVPAASPGGLAVALRAGTLTIGAATEGQSIEFAYQPQCGSDSKPCYHVFTALGTGPGSVSGGACSVTGPGTVECPTDGVGRIVVRMAPASTFTFNDGSHHVLCSPVPLTVQTGTELANVDVWNGCSETIVCAPATQVATIEADAADEVKGKCFAVNRH